MLGIPGLDTERMIFIIHFRRCAGFRGLKVVVCDHLATERCLTPSAPYRTRAGCDVPAACCRAWQHVVHRVVPLAGEFVGLRSQIGEIKSNVSSFSPLTMQSHWPKCQER